MRLSRFLPVSAACLVLPLAAAAPALAEDMPGSGFTSGNWSGGAWADETGAFVDCYFGVSYTSGEALSISLAADDTLTVYMTGPGAQFQPGKVYNAHLMTEVGWPIDGQAFGSNESYVGFTIAGIDDAIDYLTQGSYLRLLGVGIDQSFDTRGMGGALAQAKSCMLTHAGQPKTAAGVGAKPSTPKLGSDGSGAKPAQLSGGAVTFKRQHLPCKAGDCK